MDREISKQIGAHDYNGRIYISISSIHDYSSEMQDIIDDLAPGLSWKQRYTELARLWNSEHPEHKLPTSTSGGGSLFAVYRISTSKMEKVMLANIFAKLKLNLSPNSNVDASDLEVTTSIPQVVNRLLTIEVSVSHEVPTESEPRIMYIPSEVDTFYKQLREDGIPDRILEKLKSLLPHLEVNEGGRIIIKKKARELMAKVPESLRNELIEIISDYK